MSGQAQEREAAGPGAPAETDGLGADAAAGSGGRTPPKAADGIAEAAAAGNGAADSSTVADSIADTGAVWDIHGGLALAKTDSVDATSSIMPVPAQLALALEQPKLGSFRPIVSLGDSVNKHQIIARSAPPHFCCLHAPSSGVVKAISSRPLLHPSGLVAPHIVIETDGRDHSENRAEDAPATRPLDFGRLCRLVKEYGIVGQGGGNYLAGRKLSDAACSEGLTLIVNACECDPYIKCDHALMLERAADVVAGIKLLRDSGGFRHIVFGIEDNTPDALEALRSAGLDEQARIKLLPSIYPIGNEKQLIYAVSGQRIGLRDHPSDVGIVCLNVGTVASIARALIHNEPVIERLVTVAGGAIARPGNVWTRIGASLSDIIGYCGGLDFERHHRTLVGGKMMGFAPVDHNTHIMRNTNALLFSDRQEDPPAPAERSCIQCGFCQDVCPAELQPQQLLSRIAAGRYHSADVDYHLFQCIECGCCDEVCPSHIPLTSYFRFAKGAMRQQTIFNRRKRVHDQNNAVKLARLARARAARERELQASHQDIDGDSSKRAELIASALKTAE